MLGKSGSQLKYILALSPALYGAAGSTGVSNLGQFGFGTVLVTLGSGGSAGTNRVLVNVLRSGTSDGTFGAFGASFQSLSAGSQMYVRSFTIDSSAVYHKVSYDNNNNGSMNLAIHLVLQAAHLTPVDQDSSCTVFSDVLGG